MSQSHSLSSANIARQRRFWTRNASSWEHHAAHNSGLLRVLDEVIAQSNLEGHETVLDLGCGSGQLALRVAPQVDKVLALDISEAMIALLETNAAAAGVTNVTAVAADMESFDLEPASMDVIVSNYALHHLRDPDKAALVLKAATWLRPGGRLVIGDMMFGRGTSARDREIIASKVRLFLRKGPAGWWRVAKNAGRFLFRLQERPLSIEAWTRLFEQAGLIEVVATPVVNEAAVVRGTRPA